MSTDLQIRQIENKAEKAAPSSASFSAFFKSRSNPKSHHIVFGAGSIALILCVALVLFVAGKSKKVQASEKQVFVISAPVEHQTAPAQDLAMPAIPSFASACISALPKSDLIVQPLVTISEHDGIPMSNDARANAPGLFKRGYVQMTKDLAAFAKNLSGYFSANNIQGLITSAVRTSTGQLDIIKQRIAERGMSSSFPALASASIRDTSAWIEAWEWLKAHHVPVNPPADYVNEDGSHVSGSLHLKGLAIDVIADDLDGLRDALAGYAESAANNAKKGLHVIGLVRERDCVHISLGK